MKAKEFDDRWSVGEDGEVTRMTIDWAVGLTVASAGASLDVRVEQPFELAGPAGDTVRLVPEGDPVDLAPALRLVRQRMSSLDAFKDGRLEIAFQDGTVLTIAAGDQFEAWELSMSDGLRIVSTPGGGITVWPAPSDSD